MVRIVNGWGEKESRQPNRDDYYKHNPTISDRKNVTQIEWTRAVQVDPVGKIKYMYPKAVRYTKSRQQYYYDHEGKMPIADAKSVWQQYIAKPLLAMIMNQYADSFNVLDNLPGLASAALSQTFNSVGFMWFKVWVHETIVGSDNVDEKLKQASRDMLGGGYYLEDLKDKRKETNKTLSKLFKGVPNYEQKLRDLVVTAGDSVSMGDIDWKNYVVDCLRILAVNSAKLIAQYYEGEIVDRPPSGLDRIRHHYLTGRQEQGAFNKAMKARLVSHPIKIDRFGNKNLASLIERKPRQWREYQEEMSEEDQKQYPFGQAFVDWQRYKAPYQSFTEWLQFVKNK